MNTIAAAEPRRLGMLGSLIGLLALAAAVLPQWVLPAVKPSKPLDQIIVEAGQRVKARLLAKAKGVEYQSDREPSPAGRLLQLFSIATVSFGLLAIALAVFALIRREEKLYAKVAAALGAGALIYQLLSLAIGALIVIAIIYAVLDHLDIF
jgi:hypothetical protein